MKFSKLVLIILALMLFLSACQTEATPIIEPDDPVIVLPIEPEPEPEPLPELPGAFFVMLDNHPNARPQANLDKADIVYEYICEWTYTRFMAGYYWQDPKVVGPVRSTRYYFAETVTPYDTVYVHVGGNMDAMAYIDQYDIHNMCDITTAGGYFFRDKDRNAPHNCFVTTENILEFAKWKNYNLNPLPELDYGELEGGTESIGVDLNYGVVKYPHKVKWEYDEVEGRYLRYLNDEVYLTADKDEIWADNIVIIEAEAKLIDVPIDSVQSELNLIGSGRAQFLRNGNIYVGTWEKESQDDHFSYKLDGGFPWLYTEGNVWVQQVNSFDDVRLIFEVIDE